jgi:hypothetical protein
MQKPELLSNDAGQSAARLQVQVGAISAARHRRARVRPTAASSSVTVMGRTETSIDLLLLFAPMRHISIMTVPVGRK